MPTVKDRIGLFRYFSADFRQISDIALPCPMKTPPWSPNPKTHIDSLPAVATNHPPFPSLSRKRNRIGRPSLKRSAAVSSVKACQGYEKIYIGFSSVLEDARESEWPHLYVLSLSQPPSLSLSLSLSFPLLSSITFQMPQPEIHAKMSYVPSQMDAAGFEPAGEGVMFDLINQPERRGRKTSSTWNIRSTVSSLPPIHC